MRIFKSIGVLALSALTLASCGSVKNLKVPTMDTSVSVVAKKGKIGEESMKHWAHADLATDTIPGISLDKAYSFLEGKTGETVIVGIIDSGIDIEHEDLKNEVWVNTNEIPGNNIDDDKNGYVDDINGWNYLGGNRVSAPEQLEITRLYAKYKTRFGDKLESDVSADDVEAFKIYKKYEKAYNASAGSYLKEMKRYAQIEVHFKAVRKHLSKDTYTIDDVKGITTLDPDFKLMVDDVASIMGRGFDEKAFMEYFESRKSKNYDLEFDGRAIVGDNPEDMNDTGYGNGHVIGTPDGDYHGTHVAGIILASRNNDLGINGVAHNAKLMTLRAVPDGDERDKDIALAIRYAVDHGAKVINMSFGKSFSPNRNWVFDAIKYAAEHDVLMVHASGNDGKNIDISDNWPNDSEDKVIEIADNVITVGALSPSTNESLPAGFSNYGKLNVDVFAPGVQIYSTLPNSKYGNLGGTSMAAPEVAGIAVLVRSYYPELTASQVKHIIMKSGTKITMNVNIPGKKGETIDFSKISVSGSLANAYNALLLADKMVK